MDYEFWFYMLVSFLIGVLVKACLPIYIGTNVNKFNNAGFGILLNKK